MICVIHLDDASRALFLDRVHIEPNSGCWLWGGLIDRMKEKS